MTVRVLTLSTLFPDMTRPNFGVFVERQCRELAHRDGVELTVIAPVGLAPWPLSRHPHYAPLTALPASERWRDLTVYRPRFTVIPKLGGRFTIASMTRAIWPLVKRLHENTPFDVIDASFFYPDGPVAQTLAKRLGIPYSVKARGADIHYWGRLPATRKAVLQAGRDAAGLLAVSEAMKRSMIALGMDGEKIRVHYTGVDLDRFAPQDRAAAKARYHLEGPVVLCVGNLITRKGQDLLIRALSHLPGVTLLLAGHGPDRPAYEKLATELGVAERVGFLGAVPHEDLPAIYNAADVMALPSASEGLANAWVEALACGTPIAISDVGGARELLTDPQAGRIVERTPDALAEALHEMLTQTPNRVATRKAALRFTWSTNGNGLFAHLAGIAESAT
ncbi:MAG: glycosyltransferase family 4 protein [Sphingobium sp.]|nr:glycosyltransferase family 4 protein [Sphingobium sp.]MBP6110870.1 glycosyltransferase family 4 protein [Sphingobium sp.]MBP8669986.1 glycosyltransferase family 4 protein [Sphingobium sp.]MBP9157149.1 glycosyltransferase family 4 protein [Sphingobium sp.]